MRAAFSFGVAVAAVLPILLFGCISGSVVRPALPSEKAGSPSSSPSVAASLSATAAPSLAGVGENPFCYRDFPDVSGDLYYAKSESTEGYLIVVNPSRFSSSEGFRLWSGDPSAPLYYSCLQGSSEGENINYVYCPYRRVVKTEVDALGNIKKTVDFIPAPYFDIRGSGRKRTDSPLAKVSYDVLDWYKLEGARFEGYKYSAYDGLINANCRLR